MGQIPVCFIAKSVAELERARRLRAQSEGRDVIGESSLDVLREQAFTVVRERAEVLNVGGFESGQFPVRRSSDAAGDEEVMWLTQACGLVFELTYPDMRVHGLLGIGALALNHPTLILVHKTFAIPSNTITERSNVQVYGYDSLKGIVSTVETFLAGIKLPARLAR